MNHKNISSISTILALIISGYCAYYMATRDNSKDLEDKFNKKVDVVRWKLENTMQDNKIERNRDDIVKLTKVVEVVGKSVDDVNSSLNLNNIKLAEVGTALNIFAKYLEQKKD